MNGEKMSTPAIDFARLTLGEVAKLEELSGLPLDRLGDEGTPKGKLLAAMAYVASRRRGTPLTWDAALELTVDQANELLGVVAVPEASDAGGEADEDAEEEAPGNG